MRILSSKLLFLLRFLFSCICERFTGNTKLKHCCHPMCVARYKTNSDKVLLPIQSVFNHMCPAQTYLTGLMYWHTLLYFYTKTNRRLGTYCIAKLYIKMQFSEYIVIWKSHRTHVENPSFFLYKINFRDGTSVSSFTGILGTLWSLLALQLFTNHIFISTKFTIDMFKLNLLVYVL